MSVTETSQLNAHRRGPRQTIRLNVSQQVITRNKTPLSEPQQLASSSPQGLLSVAKRG